MPNSSPSQPRRAPRNAPKQGQPPPTPPKNPPRRRLYNVIQVRFPDSFKAIECDLGSLYVEEGVRVVVQTRRGPVLGTTSGQRYRKVLPSGSLQLIQRIASEADLKRELDHKALATQAIKQAIERARALELDMKFITAEIMLDGSVLVCYFSAEGRVDFRNLVRDLSRFLGMRIEMHQVGVRNGAGSIGGIGSCGRELCCSTFLNDFEPVAIRMVKDQGLTLNPKKVSGMCGRLMCCLVYEHSAYVRGRKTLPKPGLAVQTSLGPGTVREVDIHRQTLLILHESGEEARFPIVEVLLAAAAPQTPRVVTIDGPLSADAEDTTRRAKQSRRPAQTPRPSREPDPIPPTKPQNAPADAQDPQPNPKTPTEDPDRRRRTSRGGGERQGRDSQERELRDQRGGRPPRDSRDTPDPKEPRSTRDPQNPREAREPRNPTRTAPRREDRRGTRDPKPPHSTRGPKEPSDKP